ncbi:phosphate ABC transporter permease PstA [Brevibacillus ginsengisoli]|uniref:phosphate ABC transporter permease PstA n=1 Tax=Brevibacillus ginsengisoli TaxID=363854 RepID=UPI003CF097C0
MNERLFGKPRKLPLLLNKAWTFFFWLMGIGSVILVGWLLYTILSRGLPSITWDFLYKLPDEIEAGGGIGPVFFNSFYVLILSMIVSLPIGIGAGIYLAEYAPNNGFTAFIRMCVESLASVPSIVFGLFGLSLFVGYFQIGLTIIGGAVSLGLLNLPVLTRVTEESIRAVPKELRAASYALGATKWQCIRTVVLPAALSGIITGISLVAGRAYGESAVIILTAGTSTSGAMWDFNLFSPGETLAVHLWYVQSEAIVPDAKEIANKSAAVLVFVVLMLNLLLRIPIWLSERKFKLR